MNFLELIKGIRKDIEGIKDDLPTEASSVLISKIDMLQTKIQTAIDEIEPKPQSKKPEIK